MQIYKVVRRLFCKQPEPKPEPTPQFIDGVCVYCGFVAYGRNRQIGHCFIHGAEEERGLPMGSLLPLSWRVKKEEPNGLF